MDEFEGKFRAWKIVQGSEFSSNIPILKNINEHLSHFDDASVANRVQELRTLYLNAGNQADFVAGFIGGPLHKIELEELNILNREVSIRAWSAYDGVNPTPPLENLLNSTELMRYNKLTVQLGDFEYPKYRPNNYSTRLNPLIDVDPNHTILQEDSRFHWLNINIEGGEIIGLENRYYNFVVTTDGEFRIGLGHYHLSGSAHQVRAAGGIEIRDGKIYRIDKQSGHYKPSDEDWIRIGTLLKNEGITNYDINAYYPF